MGKWGELITTYKYIGWNNSIYRGRNNSIGFPQKNPIYDCRMWWTINPGTTSFQMRMRIRNDVDLGNLDHGSMGKFHFATYLIHCGSCGDRSTPKMLCFFVLFLWGNPPWNCWKNQDSKIFMFTPENSRNETVELDEQVFWLVCDWKTIN